MTNRVNRWVPALVALLLATAAGSVLATPAQAATTTSLGAVVPAPVSATPNGTTYSITPGTRVYASPGATAVAADPAGSLRPSPGYRLPVRTGREPAPGISLLLSGAPSSVGDQGYQLDIGRDGLALRARSAAGLFAGVQTLRQLLPAKVESATVRRGPWMLPGGRIVDHPRLAYRGAMLDVSRHFFPVATIERYLDEIAMYKVNHLHLHLSDDQGWRIAITGWPRLTGVGGSTEVGGGAGGYYTQSDYRAIVAYAQRRFITVVPEIDMPGHTNAALASYADLNCNGVAPPLYTGTDVGFSSLCVGKDITYRFIDDVIGRLAALTPGPYLHIGGDESHATSAADYVTFINRAQRIVAAHGKTVIGWHDIVRATLLPSTIAQFWDTTGNNPAVAAAARNGTRLIMSPASRAYLDMKYTASTPLGQDWAGLIDVQQAYGWDPGGYLVGAPAAAVSGVEAPLWTETVLSRSDIEYMVFPRLPAIAELGWSTAASHDWGAFSRRLAAQGPRWTVLGINYYHSTQVPWPA
jgi:hexosaminidase